MQNLDEAEQYHLKSIEIKLEINDLPMLASSYSNIAIVYEKRGDIQMALEHLDMAKKIAFEKRVNEIIPTVLQQEARIFSKQGNYKKSNVVLTKLITYQDSLSQQNKASFTKLYERNMTSRKAQSGLSHHETDSHSLTSNSWLVKISLSLCLAMLLVVIILFFVSNKNQASSKLKINNH